ncbi:hypothetical protein N825_20540 [Skermanella stibiiresistens SB22]|uniref:Uncharacterized protein n=1 Tax=Skermanella stibiiresistens SB22 TaxID=1385369 RepID=W9HCB3_9PROT|nr:hypothetical protein N825_20540 [Skermanella stibiiresistens SB22]
MREMIPWMVVLGKITYMVERARIPRFGIFQKQVIKQ